MEPRHELKRADATSQKHKLAQIAEGSAAVATNVQKPQKSKTHINPERVMVKTVFGIFCCGVKKATALSLLNSLKQSKQKANL